MFRVLLDARVTQGGVGRYARDLVEAMTTIADAPRIELFRPGWSSPPFTPWGRWRVARRVESSAADLLHGAHLEIPRTERPSVVTIHDLIPLRVPASMPRTVDRWIFRRILDSSLKRAREVIVPSDMTADALREYGVQGARISVVPHGVSPLFKPATPDERDDARKSFAGGRRYVLTVASPRTHKNTGSLSAIADEIARSTGAAFVTFGSGASESPSLRSLGTIDDDTLRRAYGGADLFLLPSLAEGFGLPILESLACGTPVVCGKEVGALAYLGAGALVVDVANPGDVMHEVGALLRDDQRRAHVAAAGMEAARAMTFERMATMTSDVYRSALSG